jgi:sugar phosphate isomerase/epimerase
VVVVVHASSFDFPPDELADWELAVLRTCEALQPHAAAAGVRFALENVLPGPATELVSRVLDQVDPTVFGACYDSSHDQIGGPRPFSLLEQWRDRLIAVQLSDRVRDFVDHVLPGEGFIDWPGLCRELQRSVFRSPLLLEVATTHSAEKDARQFLARASQRARALAAAVQ